MKPFIHPMNKGRDGLVPPSVDDLVAIRIILNATIMQIIGGSEMVSEKMSTLNNTAL